jgi:outer membrane protein assembly factor BamD
MHRRSLLCLFVVVLLFSLAACHNKKVQNPIADVDSKQPDKVLFDKAMDAMKHNRFDVARISLQTLINTYPDSEYVARAKLAIGDSWYAEGGSAALAQAEAEYRDFKTFFPNMPEAAEAQLKIAGIEYQQLEKPDRDYTHAKRAEDEYRSLILEFPDSKLVPQAKERLREVQEVLAEREFRVGRFYYLRESYAAAVARLQSLVDAYPLYSGADEALYLLGDSYEREAEMFRKLPPLAGLDPQTRDQMIKDFHNKAAETFSRIVTRYPVTDRANDAVRRLEAMKRPVPKPTPEAIAQNRAEEDSRGRVGLWPRMWGNFHKHPEMATSAKVGEPTLVDPKPTSAPDIVRQTTNAMRGAPAGSDSHTVSVETVGTGAPPKNEPTPRSDTAPAKSGDPETKIPELTPISPNATPDSSKDPGNATPLSAPPQVNDAAQSGGANQTSSPDSAGGNSQTNPTDNKSQSSSKQKKKRKLVLF